MPSIIAICTANICRSPMAEALLKKALAAEPEPLRSLNVISAGIAANDGNPITPHSKTALKNAGIPSENHKSRLLTQEMLNDAIAVYCMTEAHQVMVEINYDYPPSKIHLLRGFIPGANQPEIPDPYGGPLASYEETLRLMQQAIPSIIAHLKKITSQK